MEAGTRRERVRRVSLAVMAISAPLPAVGVALSGSGLWWAILPTTAGAVTVATMRAKPVPPPVPAPPQPPAQPVLVAQVLPVPACEPGPDLTVLRALVGGATATGREAV